MMHHNEALFKKPVFNISVVGLAAVVVFAPIGHGEETKETHARRMLITQPGHLPTILSQQSLVATMNRSAAVNARAWPSRPSACDSSRYI